MSERPPRIDPEYEGLSNTRLSKAIYITRRLGSSSLTKEEILEKAKEFKQRKDKRLQESLIRWKRNHQKLVEQGEISE